MLQTVKMRSRGSLPRPLCRAYQFALHHRVCVTVAQKSGKRDVDVWWALGVQRHAGTEVIGVWPDREAVGWPPQGSRDDLKLRGLERFPSTFELGSQAPGHAMPKFVEAVAAGRRIGSGVVRALRLRSEFSDVEEAVRFIEHTLDHFEELVGRTKAAERLVTAKLAMRPSEAAGVLITQASSIARG